MPPVQGSQFKNYCWKRNCRTFSQSGYTILYSHQHYMRVLTAPHLHQHLVCHSLVKVSGGSEGRVAIQTIPHKNVMVFVGEF